jgi:outer membrane lipoprotein-sorting protein
MKSQLQRFVKFIGLGCGGLLFVTLILSVSTANALDPNTKDAHAIVKATADRDDGNKGISRSVWTITDSSGRSRERVLHKWSLDFSGGTKNLLIYESPADVRNTGFLSIDYEDANKDDDQWLYLPALHKSTRIASSQKSDSFLGTDLSYYDLSKPNVEANDYKLIEASTKVDNDECWLVESTPKTDKEKKESGYLKTQMWISKKTLLPLQAKIWMVKGQKMKYIKFSDIKQVDGVWTPNKIVVRTMKGEKVESSTTVQFTSIKYNQASVKDDDFTQTRLEKGL